MELSALSVVLSIITMWIAWKLYSMLTDPLRKIPGPIGLPLIGNILQLDGEKPHISFMQMAKKYGPLVRIRIFNQDQVVVNSFDLAWEVLITKSHEFSGRPSAYRAEFACGDDFFLKEGKKMSIKKKMVMKAMKNYGSGLEEMEEVLSSAIAEFVSRLEDRVNEKVDFVEELGRCICVIAASLIYGERFEADSQIVADINDVTTEVLKFFSPAAQNAELDSFPWLRHVPFINRKYIIAENKLEALKDKTHRPQIKKAVGDYESGSVHNDGLLHKIVRAIRTEVDEYGEQLVADTFLEGMLVDMIGGGIQTTHRTLTQLVLELCKKPEVTKKIQNEIDEAIGRSRHPRLCDRSQMPYTCAALAEIHRLISVAPLVGHKTVKDTTLGGYVLPKDTPVVLNLWAVHHDVEFFRDPYDFVPERFLTKDGKFRDASDIVRKRVLSFGGGPRVCAGEIFAKSRIFLTIVSILQKFNLELCHPDINSDVQTYEAYLLMVTPKKF